jgi:predicted kinase
VESDSGSDERGRTSALVIVAGRPGSGKSTLATSLAHLLAWPLISRDEVNNGLTHVLGASMTKNALAEKTFDVFSDLLRLLTAQKVAVIAEAAFQNARWQRALEPVLPEVDVRLVHCVVDPRLAQERVRRRKGQSAPADPPAAADFDPLSLPGPSLTVSTVDGYDPPLAEIAAFARS